MHNAAMRNGAMRMCAFACHLHATADSGPLAFCHAAGQSCSCLSAHMQVIYLGMLYKHSSMLGHAVSCAAYFQRTVVSVVPQHAELLLSTPPSIPARHQSYGYEPGPGNSLVMQPPPAPAAADSTGSAGKAAASSPSTISNSSRLRSPGRPSTVPNSRGGSGAGTAAAGGRSSSARSPLREPTRQLQQQLQAVQQPSPVLQQLAGSVSPR